MTLLILAAATKTVVDTGSANHIDTVMLVGCYIAILSHAVWTFKSIQGTRDMFFKHEAKGSIHQDSKELMFKDVCDERTKRMEQSIANVQSEVVEVKEGMQQGFSEIKELIKGSQK